jgi:hypothetical protein
MILPVLLQKGNPVQVQLAFLVKKYKDYTNDKELMQKIFNSRVEMSKQYLHLVLTYIRKIRAFLFKEPEIENTDVPTPD